MNPEATTHLETQLQRFSPADAAIAAMSEEYAGLEIKGLDDHEGFELVRAARLRVRKHRTEVEKTRKELKADALAYGRAVDGEAKRITTLLLQVETPLAAQESTIKEARERQEQERVEALMAPLREAGSALGEKDVAKMDGATYEAALANAQAAHAKREAEREELERLRAAEAKRKEEEAERERKEAAEKAEAARLERIEHEKRERELAEERKKLEAEREEIARERAKIEAAKTPEPKTVVDREGGVPEKSELMDEVLCPPGDEPLSASQVLAGCAEFVRWACERLWEGIDIDGGEAQDKLEELRLIDPDVYDPEVHGDMAAETGDKIYTLNGYLLQ
jgi:hypothetical protein